MADKLDDADEEALRAELDSRATAQSEGRDALFRMPTESPLAAVPSEDLVEALRDKQRVIYGIDDRKDYFEIASQAVKNNAASVAALFDGADVVDQMDGTFRLKTERFKSAYGLCASEPFAEQPCGAFCSGVLVAQDVIATAGHCIDPDYLGTIENVRFVFGFRMSAIEGPILVVPKSQVYSGVEIVGHRLTTHATDWALVRLDRPVTGRPAVEWRKSGKIADDAAVYVLGHPCGLPLKYAPNARVTNNRPVTHFKANLDAYGGNSGSPVFNAQHKLEGVLSRGKTDFVRRGKCNVSLVVPTSGSDGEDVTRVSEIVPLLRKEISPIDTAAIQNVVDEEAEELQRVYGTFDPDRLPALQIRTFPNVTDIRAAVSPDCSYRLVKEALDSAQSTLDIYIYNATADHLLELVAQARQRGVAIRLMYDVMDTRGSEKQKLAALGVTLREAPSSGRRKVFTVCHQKFAVVDSGSVLIGSANWAASAIPKATVPGKFKKGNREWLALVKNIDVAKWFGNLFEADWQIPALEGPAGLLEPLPVLEMTSVEMRAAAVKIPDEVFDVEAPNLGDGAVVTPILSPDNYFDLVRERIRSAQRSIDIEQQYIVATGPKTRGLLEDLAAAKRRGVTIRIIVSPAFEENWKKTVKTLEAAGLRDRLKAINLDSFTHLHNKGVLIDERYTVITSTNMSENSITQAREAGILVASETFASYYRRAVDVDWSSGLDPDDVPSHLANIARDVALVDEPSIEIHPADARLI